MTHFQARVTVRLQERTSNRTVSEVQDWQSLVFSKRMRRAADGTIQIPKHEITTEVVGLLADENLAIYIRHEFEVPASDGSDSGEWKRTEFHGPIAEGRLETLPEMWYFSFNCDLIYLTDRAIQTEGVDRIDLGSLTAIAAVRQHLTDQLLSPSDGDRAIDVPASLAGSASGGGLVDRPVRWSNLADEIEQICIAGNIMVESRLSGTTVQYLAKPIDVQTEGVGGTIPPVSKALSGSDLTLRYNFRSVKNRAYVLGQNTGASRTVRTRTTWTGGRMRETVIDARHLSSNAELDDWGDAKLEEAAQAEIELSLKAAERAVSIDVGMKVTIAEIGSSDATAPDIGPLDILVVGKRWRLRPNQNDEIDLVLGHESLTAGQLFRQVARRAEQASYA